jgi:plastocyanin
MVLSTGGLGGGGSPSTARGGGIFDVAMVDFTFTPNAPIIQPGTTVRWTNNGLFQHTSTRTPTWDSGIVSPGNFFDFTFANAGLAYDYVCMLHFGMEGTINVARFGDANLDGLVNLADFNTLASNFGQSGRTWDSGDFNGDGNVNLNDFNLLAANFGREIEPAGLTLTFGFGNFVPEPTGAAVLFLPAVLGLSRRRRGRNRR